tara:strand:+ start:298 stop:597 length:300 start_codon:yes stop_codon:yes gene_type:complete
MGIISFIITDKSSEYSFQKKNFQYAYTNAGATNYVFVFFQNQGSLITNDYITLTVKAERLHDVLEHISKSILNKGYTEIKHSQTSGIGKYITAMQYTSA